MIVPPNLVATTLKVGKDYIVQPAQLLLLHVAFWASAFS
jgi:hypothetical protein